MKKLKIKNEKLKIGLVGLLVVGVILVGGYWVWSSWIQEKRPISEQKVTCDQKCISLGYASGVCRTFPVLPNMTKCKKDEIDIGHTIDCRPPTKDGEPIGGGGWACCCKVKERIQQVTIATDKTEYEQGKIMTVTVANRTEAGIFYSSSPFMLYKYKDGEWVASPYPWQRGLEEPQMETEPLYEGFEEVQPLLTEIKANTDKKFIDSVDTKWIDPGKYKVEFKYTLDPDKEEWKIIYSNEFRIVKRSPIVPGGDCSYDEFRGRCKVTSIFNENKIKFRFIPSEPLKLEDIGWVEKEEDIVNKEYRYYAGYLGLKCLDKYPILKEDLEKCSIKENAIFNCKIELITKGTCSPVNFRFY